MQHNEQLTIGNAEVGWLFRLQGLIFANAVFGFHGRPSFYSRLVEIVALQSEA
jgi:hypothetical protein